MIKFSIKISKLILFIYFLNFHLFNAYNESVDIRINDGLIRGYVSYKGGIDKPANVFKGIPFAKPPIGDLRFKKLVKPDSWDRILDTTLYSPACLSNTTRTTSPQHDISEDCIYMNIFADAKCTIEGQNKCPIIFYIHGGIFGYDSAIMFNETAILQKYATDNLIFVIPAYRLGIFGFLDLGNDAVVPRNLGLHDIIFALEWTKREIENFGGNPNQITIMGNSAGAVIVEYLATTPAIPYDLFDKAIITSASPHYKKDMNFDSTLAILKNFNCLQNATTNHFYDDVERVMCLKNIKSLDLLDCQALFEQSGIFFRGPTTDSEILPETDYAKMLKYWRPRTILITSTVKERIFLEENLEFECNENVNTFGYKSKATFDACMKRYTYDYESGGKVKVTSEPNHAEALATSLVNTLRGGTTFMGLFSLAGHDTHVADLLYFFSFHYENFRYSPEDYLMENYYPKFIKRFVRDGIPDPDWKPINEKGENYFILDFKVENKILKKWPHLCKGILDPEGVKFWLLDEAQIEMDFLNESVEPNRIKMFPLNNLVIRLNQNYTDLNFHTNFQNMSDCDGQNKLANGPMIISPKQQVWSNFWLLSSLVMILMVGILILLISHIVYRFNNPKNSNNGYPLSETSSILDKCEYEKYT